ncbi:uncharacterized protein LOC114312733 isoform X1 [Camellia sinensis]|uniref:uncharacterized protein LOC114312733 isoform X1 n=1 Tax=Camellia sinensis TaxID=4442 RepID=UPI0010357C53|nr:uncharacterized protein LOC114312733 isoform X1 [Camellia sinensis]
MMKRCRSALSSIRLRDENGHIIEHTEVRFPSVGTETDIEIFWGVICSNLVANNFTVESSNNSVLPSGLRCLQRNFPCNRNSSIYYNFSIKCSGPQISSNNQIMIVVCLDLLDKEIELKSKKVGRGVSTGGGQSSLEYLFGGGETTNNPRPVRSQGQGSNNGPPQKPTATSQPADNTTSI